MNEVIIDDLPNNKPAWIGNLSLEDGGLGWNMWEGTDTTFAKILLFCPLISSRQKQIPVLASAGSILAVIALPV